MNRVGILVGREKTFPDALINAINERGKGETIAEFMKLGWHSSRLASPVRSGSRPHLSRSPVLPRDAEAPGPGRHGHHQ